MKMIDIRNIVCAFIYVSIIFAFVKATPVETKKREVIAEFWEKLNFCGSSIKFYENERIQNLLHLRNKLLSFKIYKPVSIFEKTYGEGACLHLKPGSYASYPKEWCNRIGSIFDTTTLENKAAELYENKNFCGRKITLAKGERLHWIRCEWNNKFSSAIVHTSIKACGRFFGEGICQSYKASKIEDLCKFDNRISSVFDENEDKVIALFYEHPKFCGRVIKVYENDRLTALLDFDNRISSYKVLKPIVVCDKPFHQGACKKLAPKDCGQLDKVWNEKISSIYDEL